MDNVCANVISLCLWQHYVNQNEEQDDYKTDFIDSNNDE